MTERSSEGLDVRRRKLLFRAWRRGVREMDLIVGRFADAYIGTLDDAALDDFERLIEAPNADLYAWVVGAKDVPQKYDTAVLRAAHHFPSPRRGEAVTAQARWQARSPSPAQRLAPGRPLLLAGVADGAEGLVVADLARSIAAARGAAGDQHGGGLPRRLAHGHACPRARLLRAGHRGSGIPGLGLFALRSGLAARGRGGAAHDGARAACAPSLPSRAGGLTAREGREGARERPAVLLTTVNAILQRVPAREMVARQSLAAAPGNLLPMAGVTQWLELNGFNRAATVREAGDYAVRGGIVDLFAPGMDAPVRLDFFGDTLESIRSFDPETQRTTAELRALDLVPMAEFQLTTRDDPAVSHRLRRGLRRGGPRRRALSGGERGSPARRHGALAAAVPPSHGNALRLPRRDASRSRAARGGSRARAACADRRLLRGAPAGARSSGRAARPTSRCRRSGSISPKPNGASVWKIPRWRGCRHSRRRKARRMPSRSRRAPGAISPPSAASPAKTSSRR